MRARDGSWWFRRALLLGSAVLLCLPRQAWAHSFGKNVGDLYAGMLHPATALEHLLAWLAFGLWSGQQDTPTAHRGLGLFAGGLAVGGVVGRLAPDVQGVTTLNLVALLLLGLVVAASWKPPSRVFLGVSFLIGLPQGHSNTFELDVGANDVVFIVGLVLVALVGIFLVIEAVLALKRDWMKIAVRVVGSWIAAVGVLVAAFSLRGGP